MIIREASQADYPALRRIYLDSRRESFFWANSEEFALEDFDKETADEYILVAESQLGIVGYASLYLPDDFIHHLFVHPDSAGQGVGTMLVKAAIDKMNKPARLKCVSENRRALAFYEKNGWRKVVEEGDPGPKYWVMVYE